MAVHTVAFLFLPAGQDQHCRLPWRAYSSARYPSPAWPARSHPVACPPHRLSACTPPVCSAGVVTTLVTPGQLPALQSMAAELGITIAELPPPPPELLSEGSGAESDLDTARRGLEDLFNLY